MSKVEEYRAALRSLPRGEWDVYLLANSGLPGPRGNIELGQAVADEGDAELFERYLAFDDETAPTGTAEEYFAFCGVLGLGSLLAEGDLARLPQIRVCANDPRWRMREGVAMALQRWGDVDVDALSAEMMRWSTGTLLEQRAAVAALCEPRLLKRPETVRTTLDVLDQVTAFLTTATDRRAEDFIALRKGLAYCWSVAVDALPEEGKPRMERWFAESDKDVRWIMRENLKKNRLLRADEAWVTTWVERLSASASH